MQIQWKRYNIFISSTFKDMDSERDIIKMKVMPALNAHYRSQHIEIQPIDLRMGVNTEKMHEEQSAQKVLSVCAEGIDSARPFFIGLVGARYGWIPPIEQWKQFISKLPDEDRKLMADTYGKSVTELEIVYGALTKHSLSDSHTLFFMRDKASYDNVPKDKLSQYCETDEEKIAKLNELRNKIQSTINDNGGHDDSVFSYHVDYDADIDEFVDTNESFQTLLFNQLKAIIDSEIESENEKEKTWWIKEREIVNGYLSKYLINTCTQMERFSAKPENIKIFGPKGAGLSTMLAHLWHEVETTTNDFCLTAVVGLTPQSRTMRGILVRWCVEIDTELGVELFDVDAFLDPEKSTFPQICDEFYWGVNQLKEKGRRVSIFIDDVDQFMAYSPSDMSMSWIDYRVNAIMTCDHAYSEQLAISGFFNFELIYLDALTRDECLKLIDFYSKQYYFELPEKLVNKIVKRKHYPRFIRSFFKIMSVCMNSATFKDIRNENRNQIDAINDTISQVYNDVFADLGDMEQYLDGWTLANFGLELLGLDKDWWKRQLDVLSKSPCGLTVKNMAEICGADWDLTEWYQIMYVMSGYFIEDPVSHTWRSQCSEVTFEDGNQENVSFETLAEYADDDISFVNEWLKPLVPYFVLRSGNEKLWQMSAECCSVSEVSANLLLSKRWFVNGDFEKFAQKLNYDEREELVNSIAGVLFSKGLAGLKVSDKEMADIMNDVLEKAQFNFMNRLKIQKTLKKVPQALSVSELYEKSCKNLWNVIDETPAQEGNQMVAFFTDGLAKVHDKKKRNLCCEALKQQLDLICSLDLEDYKLIDDNGYYVSRIDSDVELEGLALWFISLCGIADKMINDNKKAPGLTKDELGSIAYWANYGYLICYHRLCQANPNNNLSAYLEVPIGLVNLDFQFRTGTMAIVDVVEQLKPFNNH